MTSLYNFTRYQSHGPSSDNRISINKSFEITFPSVFCYENKIFSYQYAILLWDKEKKAVGIHFTNNKSEDGVHKLTRSSKGGGARISAKGFLNSNQIQLDIYSGRYQFEKYNDDILGMLYIFKLKKP